MFCILIIYFSEIYILTAQVYNLTVHVAVMTVWRH